MVTNGCRPANFTGNRNPFNHPSFLAVLPFWAFGSGLGLEAFSSPQALGSIFDTLSNIHSLFAVCLRDPRLHLLIHTCSILTINEQLLQEDTYKLQQCILFLGMFRMVIMFLKHKGEILSLTVTPAFLLHIHCYVLSSLYAQCNSINDQHINTTWKFIILNKLELNVIGQGETHPNASCQATGLIIIALS